MGGEPAFCTLYLLHLGSDSLQEHIEEEKKYNSKQKQTNKNPKKGTRGKRILFENPSTTCPFYHVQNGTTVEISKVLDQNKTGLFPAEG